MVYPGEQNIPCTLEKFVYFAFTGCSVCVCRLSSLSSSSSVYTFYPLLKMGFWSLQLVQDCLFLPLILSVFPSYILGFYCLVPTFIIIKSSLWVDPFINVRCLFLLVTILGIKSISSNITTSTPELLFTNYVEGENSLFLWLSGGSENFI